MIGDRIQPYLPLKSQGTARYQGLLRQNTGIIQQISGRDQELKEILRSSAQQLLNWPTRCICYRSKLNSG